MKKTFFDNVQVKMAALIVVLIAIAAALMLTPASRTQAQFVSNGGAPGSSSFGVQTNFLTNGGNVVLILPPATNSQVSAPQFYSVRQLGLQFSGANTATNSNAVFIAFVLSKDGVNWATNNPFVWAPTIGGSLESNTNINIWETNIDLGAYTYCVPWWVSNTTSGGNATNLTFTYCIKPGF